MHSIGSQLKVWRKASGLQQDEAAAHLELSPSTYQNYERDTRAPNTAGWLAFARAGINTNWLLTNEGEMLLEGHQVDSGGVMTARDPAAALYQAMTPGLMIQGEKKQAAARISLNSGLLLSCLAACTAVHGEPFQAETSAVQMEYAANFYSLLERMAEVSPWPEDDPLKAFIRLESVGLADLLRTFLKLDWARKFPLPDMESWAF